MGHSSGSPLSDWENKTGHSVSSQDFGGTIGGMIDDENDAVGRVALVSSEDEVIQALEMAAATVGGSLTVVWVGKLPDEDAMPKAVTEFHP